MNNFDNKYIFRDDAHDSNATSWIHETDTGENFHPSAIGYCEVFCYQRTNSDDLGSESLSDILSIEPKYRYSVLGAVNAFISRALISNYLIGLIVDSINDISSLDKPYIAYSSISDQDLFISRRGTNLYVLLGAC